jgi:Zn-dependent protease with chaperone function
MTALRSTVGWLLWPLAVVGVAGHLSLGAVAVAEYVRLPWLFSEPYELTAVTVVVGSAVVALSGGLTVAWRAASGSRVVRRLLHAARTPVPGSVQTVGKELKIAAYLDVVKSDEAFAVTYRLLRPRILLSTALVEVLDRAELTAVLLHERHHVRRRDPLRLLASRLFAGYGWFLPLLRWRAQRSALWRELAADRAATASVGVAAVAGALLKLADRRAPGAVAAINPMGSLPERIAQLEGQSPTRGFRRWWLVAAATFTNLVGLSAAAICCAGLGVAMAGGMT